MAHVKVLLPLLVLLAAPLAVAEAPADAAAVWDAQNPDRAGAVLGLSVDPVAPPAGTQFQQTLRFAPSLAITAITYQMCDVGDSCFVADVPLTHLGDGVWTFDTADERDHNPNLAGLRKYTAGQHIGVQFFITLDDGSVLEFPHGEECDPYAPDDAWLACQETHYFTVDIQEARSTPPLGLAATLLVAFVLAGVLRRG